MNLDDYQRAVMSGGLDKSGDDEEVLITTVLGIAGEAGEIADIIKKTRHKGGDLTTTGTLDELSDEGGDLLWYLVRYAGLLGMTLAELAELNMRKLAVRHPMYYAYLFEDSGWISRGKQDPNCSLPGGVTPADNGELGKVKTRYL